MKTFQKIEDKAVDRLLRYESEEKSISLGNFPIQSNLWKVMILPVGLLINTREDSLGNVCAHSVKPTCHRQVFRGIDCEMIHSRFPLGDKTFFIGHALWLIYYPRRVYKWKLIKRALDDNSTCMGQSVTSRFEGDGKRPVINYYPLRHVHV